MPKRVYSLTKTIKEMILLLPSHGKSSHQRGGKMNSKKHTKGTFSYNGEVIEDARPLGIYRIL